MKYLLTILILSITCCAEMSERDIEELEKQDATVEEGGDFEMSIIEPDEKFYEEEDYE